MVTREVNGPHAAYNCPCADSKCPGKQSYVDWKEKKAAAILNAAFCAFESTHRPGIRCNVCGHLEPIMEPDDPDVRELENAEWRERFDIETERLEDRADTDYGEEWPLV